MLNNWLAPVPLKEFEGFNQLTRHHLGKQLVIYKDKFPELKSVQIAIVGIGEEDANQVRRFLYSMSSAFGSLKIADLGNARNEDTSFVIPIIEELLLSGIFPLIIGRDPNLTAAQFQAYRNLNTAVNLVLIDEKIPFSLSKKQDKPYLNRIIQEDNHLFSFGQIGYQAHFTAPAVLSKISEYNFECIRLGKIHSSMEETEPLIRDADLLSFNLAILKQSEAPGLLHPSPSGLFSEEACKLSHYAGMSDKLSSAGFYGFRFPYDQNNQTAQVAAQLIWYFLEGFYNRKNDYPASTEGLVEYIVQFKAIEQPITFWKSKRSGRWWMQVPVKEEDKKLQRHRLVPCSYQDYQEACHDNFAERLLAAYRRLA